jgi:hypothetical protein
MLPLLVSVTQRRLSGVLVLDKPEVVEESSAKLVATSHLVHPHQVRIMH